MDFLNSINFFGGLSSAIQAALLLIIGLIAAAIARYVVKKILIKVFDRNAKKQLAEKNDTDAKDSIEAEGEDVKRGIFAGLMENRVQLAGIIGNLVFAVVFLLFLPGALDKLGVDSVASPISGMARKFVEFIPRIIAAIIILVFGYFLSKLVRDILKVILQKTKIDSLQGKIGVKNARNATSFSGIISNIVFALLMIVFVIAALQALQLYSISDPASAMLGTVFTYLPLLFAALIVIVIGIFIANIVGGLLENIIAGTGFDDRIGEIMPKNKDGNPAIAFSKLLGIIVKVIIIIFFVVAGLRIMNIEVLTKIGTTIIAYMPNILAAIIVFIVAWFVADKISKVILKANPEADTLAKAVKWIIYLIAAFMILSQLHIASNIVHILFMALVIGLAGAFAIAFGVGGRFWAAKKLEELDENIEKQKAKREEYKAMRAAEEEKNGKSDKEEKHSFFSGLFGKRSDSSDKSKKDSGSSSGNSKKGYEQYPYPDHKAQDAAGKTGDAAENAADSAADAAGSVGDKVKNGAGDAADNIKDGSGTVADSVENGAETVADNVKDGAGAVADKVKDGSEIVTGKTEDVVKNAADTAEDAAKDSPYYYKNKKKD